MASVCEKCTFINDDDDTTCQLCDTPLVAHEVKHASSSRSNSSSSSSSASQPSMVPVRIRCTRCESIITMRSVAVCVVCGECSTTVTVADCAPVATQAVDDSDDDDFLSNIDSAAPSNQASTNTEAARLARQNWLDGGRAKSNQEVVEEEEEMEISNTQYAEFDSFSQVPQRPGGEQKLDPRMLRFMVDKCSICLNELSDDLCAAACGHVFHAQCGAQITNNKCPVCRKHTQSFAKLFLDPISVFSTLLKEDSRQNTPAKKGKNGVTQQVDTARAIESLDREFKRAKEKLAASQKVLDDVKRSNERVIARRMKPATMKEMIEKRKKEERLCNDLDMRSDRMKYEIAKMRPEFDRLSLLTTNHVHNKHPVMSKLTFTDVKERMKGTFQKITYLHKSYVQTKKDAVSAGSRFLGLLDTLDKKVSQQREDLNYLRSDLAAKQAQASELERRYEELVRKRHERAIQNSSSSSSQRSYSRPEERSEKAQYRSYLLASQDYSASSQYGVAPPQPASRNKLEKIKTLRSEIYGNKKHRKKQWGQALNTMDSIEKRGDAKAYASFNIQRTNSGSNSNRNQFNVPVTSGSVNSVPSFLNSSLSHGKKKAETLQQLEQTEEHIPQNVAAYLTPSGRKGSFHGNRQIGVVPKKANQRKRKIPATASKPITAFFKKKK